MHVSHLSDTTWSLEQEPGSMDVQFQSVDKISTTFHPPNIRLMDSHAASQWALKTYF